MFSDDALAPRLIADTNVHIGILLAPLIAIGLWFMLEKSLLGFQFRVLGQATRAARFAGFSENRLVWIAMLISGGLAGLAGLLEVDRHAGSAYHDAVARLWLHRDHRCVPGAAESARE